MKLVFKDKSQETQKIFLKEVLDFFIDKYDGMGGENYNEFRDMLIRGRIDKYNIYMIDTDGRGNRLIDRLKALDIWEEEEIEIGTPCKFWDNDEDNFIIAYYGGYNENAYYKHRANLISGESYSDYKNYEPITGIPKYRGAK